MSTPRTTTRFNTVGEVASMLRVSKMTVYRLVDEDALPGFRVGRSIRIPTRAVWDYLDGVRVNPLPVEEQTERAPDITDRRKLA